LDRIHDGVVGDLLLVEEREDRLVPDNAGDVVEKAFVRAERRVGDSLEDDATFVRARNAVVEVGRELVGFVA
jgi:hypothetical protein